VKCVSTSKTVVLSCVSMMMYNKNYDYWSRKTEQAQLIAGTEHKIGRKQE
jgi:hypothetical protein